MGAWYERSQKELSALEDAYNDLLDAAQSYQAVLEELRKEVEAKGGDAEFMAWLSGQVRRVGAFSDLAESRLLDGLLRFSDRNVRIRHWEEGSFL